MLTARFFEPTDKEYTAVVTVHDALWPDERHFPIGMWRENDEEWPETALNQRFVLEEDGRIIGYGACFEKYWQHQQGTVHIEFHVHPDEAAQSKDRLLYDAIFEFLSSQKAAFDTIATEAREDRTERVNFLVEQGFRPTMRSPRSFLSVPDFDPTAYRDLQEGIAKRGIRITTLRDRWKRDPDWKQKLFDLRWAIVQDVPAVQPPTRPTMAEFEHMVLDDPALNRDAWFIAVDSGSSLNSGLWVGMSNLWLNDITHKRLDAGLTGVLQDYRRRGIATALKVQTILFAQQLGALSIETDNEENNPMYDLNLMLGFQPKAAWVSFHREFKKVGI